MAGDFTKLSHSFFDSSIRKESAETRIVFLALISKCDTAGVVRATDDAIAGHACVPLEATREALERLSSSDPGSTTPDEEGRRVVKVGPNQWRVVNFRKYWSRDAQPDRRAYKTEKQREYRLRDAGHDVDDDGPRRPQSPQVDSGHRGEERRGEQKESLSSDVRPAARKSRFAEDSLEYQLSADLLGRIRSRNPNHKGDPQHWATHVDRMIRLDGREIEDIRRVIAWCQADEFWQNNVLSTEKLRQQFDQLLLKSQPRKPLRAVERPEGLAGVAL